MPPLFTTFRPVLFTYGILLLLSPATLPALGHDAANVVLTGGKVVTLDQRFPVVQAMSIRGDRIHSVGTTAAIGKQIGPHTEVIQLHGELVIPGFIEGHGHFLSLGQSKMILDLTGAKTWDDIVSQVARAVEQTPPGTWILGRGWHQSKWQEVPQPSVDGTPTNVSLSAISPQHPVLLTHASGHMAIANQHAMTLARITATTPDPEGGEILREHNGTPTGVLRERAAGLVSRVHAQAEEAKSDKQRQAKTLEALQLAAEECLRHGITSFHDAGSPMSMVDLYKELADTKQLPVRLWVMLNSSNQQLEEHIGDYRIIGYGDNHLTVRAIKRLVDGALGSHGAWLLEPYSDLPSSTGLNTFPMHDLSKTAALALNHNFQLCVHAIGDRANREVLDVYERAFQTRPESKNLRWRIEHAQHLHPDDIPRFRKLNVIAAMQAVHATSDGPFVVARLGQKRASSGAYAWRSLLETGAIIVNGTDTPVEPVDPIAGFHASITRLMKNEVAFLPAQCMTREEALRSYTINGAYAAFEEDLKGTLTPGKLADIAVLSQDIMTIPAEKVRSTEIVMTIVGGKVLYRKSK